MPTKSKRAPRKIAATIAELGWRVPPQEDLKKGPAEANAGKFVRHDAVVGKLRRLMKHCDR
jgi:hypothetical protein